MELYQLKTFVVVAEEGHLTRAAERLFISQPAVSAHIKALEEELGVALFVRGPRGMALTEQGRLLRQRAQATLDAADGLLFEAKSLRQELIGQLKIGLNTDAVFLRIPQLYALVGPAYPRLELKFSQSTSFVILDDLAAGKLDAGFVFGEVAYPEVETVDLGDVSLRVAAPAAWAERIKGADWPELAAMPWIWATNCPCNKLAEQMLSKRGLCPNKVMDADHETILRQLVAAGQGLALLRQDDADDAVARGEAVLWQGGDISVPASFVFPRGRRDDPLLRVILDAVAEIWELAEARAPGAAG